MGVLRGQLTFSPRARSPTGVRLRSTTRGLTHGRTAQQTSGLSPSPPNPLPSLQRTGSILLGLQPPWGFLQSPLAGSRPLPSRLTWLLTPFPASSSPPGDFAQAVPQPGTSFPIFKAASTLYRGPFLREPRGPLALLPAVPQPYLSDSCGTLYSHYRTPTRPRPGTGACLCVCPVHGCAPPAGTWPGGEYTAVPRMGGGTLPGGTQGKARPGEGHCSACAGRTALAFLGPATVPRALLPCSPTISLAVICPLHWPSTQWASVTVWGSG